jgi:hypothetical protein
MGGLFGDDYWSRLIALKKAVIAQYQQLSGWIPYQ